MAHKHEGRVRFIRVDIKQSEEGLLVATSSSVPGLLVVAKSEFELREDIPATISALLKEQFGETFRVLPAILDENENIGALESWAVVPSVIAATGHSGAAY